MADTQTPSNERLATPEAREALRGPHAMTTAIEGVERALGAYVPLAENLSETDVKTMRDQLADPTTVVYDDFRDVSRLAEAMARMKAGQLEKFNKGDPAKVREWVLANRQITYNQYLPAVIGQLTGAMRLFEADLNDMLPLLPEKERADMLAERDRAVLYMQHLQTLIEERTKLAALYEVTGKLVAAKGGAEVYKKEVPALLARKEALLKSMRPSARAAFEAYERGSLAYEAEKDPAKKTALRTKAMADYNAYVLSTENELIETIKGNPTGKDIPSVPKDFLPQRAYIKLLQARYTQIQKIQIEIANSKQNPEAIKAAQAELGAIRRDAMNRLFVLTQHLESHHVSAAELAALQNMFEHGVDPDAHVSIPYDATSPDRVHDIAEKIFESTLTETGAKDFHLQRLEAMVTAADTAFSPKGLEYLTEEGAMASITNVDQLSESIRSIMTLKGVLPENETTKGMNQWFDEVFPLYLNESLDNGVTADGKPATRAEKLEKIQAVILRFRDSGTVAAMKKTLSLLRSLPKSADAVGEQVQQDVVQALASERFDTSPLGRKVMIAGKEVTVNTATAYALLHGQLRSDSEKFHGAYRDFLGEMDRLVDLRLGLIVDKNIVQANWGTLTMILGGSSIALYGGALAAPYVLSKTPGWAADAVKAGYRLSTSRLAPFVAVQGARTYLDYQQWAEQAERVRSDRMRMIGELRASGFEEDTEAGEGMYTYNHDGVKCTVSVKELSEAMDGKTNASGVRFATSAAELAYLVNAARLSARAGGKLVARAIPVLIVIEIAVETYQYGANQNANRQFLAKCPPWLIGKLAARKVQVDQGQEKIAERSSLQQTIGNTPYEFLSTASEAMLTDLVTDNSDLNKKELRKKMVFAIMHDELRDFPELLGELYPGGAGAVAMDEFYKGDFEDVFLKVFKARVYKSAKGNVSWEQAQEGRISGASYVPTVSAIGLRGETPDTSEVDVRAAIREAAAVTVAHLREKRYLDALDLQKRYAALPADKQDARVKGLIDSSVTTAGAVEIMGTPLAKSGLKQTRSTRIAHIAETLYAQAGVDDFTVDVSDQPGMAGSIDFSDSAAVRAAFVQDKAMRLRLGNTYARTLAERDEKKLNDDWPGVPYHLRMITAQAAENLSHPFDYGTGPGFDVELSFAQAASDNIRKQIGKKSLRPPLSLWSVLGADSGQLTVPALAKHTTEDALELFEGEKGLIEKRAAMRRDETMEKELNEKYKTNAFIFARNEPDQRICARMLSDAKGISADLGPIIGVLFEGQKLDTGSHHFAVLGTFVFQDPKTKQVTIAQKGASSGSVVRVEGSSPFLGTFVFPDARTLQMKPGMDVLLKKIKTAETEREAAEKARIEKQRREQEEYRRQWNEQKSQRERVEKARKDLRGLAIERAKAGDALRYVPGELVYKKEFDEYQSNPERPGNFRTSFKGWDVQLSLPEYPVQPAFNARTETRGVMHAGDLQHYKFYARKGDDARDFNVSFYNIDTLTPEKAALVRAVLTQRFDVSGHEQAKDEGFQKHVRQHEIGRIIDMASYKSDWTDWAEGVRGNFYRAIFDLYEECPDKYRGAFLEKLYDSLVDSATKPIAAGGTFDAIRDTLKTYVDVFKR